MMTLTTKTLGNMYPSGGSPVDSASFSFLRLFTARRKKAVALVSSLTLLAFCLLPRHSLNIASCQDIARAVIVQSVQCAFFYHSTLPILIIEKYMKGLETKSGSRHHSDNKRETPSGASTDCAIAPAVKSAVKIKSTLHRGPVPAALPAVIHFFNDAPDGTGDDRKYGDGLVTALILLFFFLLPRSSIADDPSIKPVNNTLSRSRDRGTGFFILLNFSNHTGRLS